ncbi:MAG: hypothetical protein ACW96X_03355 [Promethearchaeota archaeon]|jgi:HSP20 family molecular chaperone IbpA
MLSDEFDDFIDKIKKHFKLDSDMFEIDFLFLPESEIKRGRPPNNKNIKGFKISYHFESGMEKPEIKIEGNVDSKKVWEYLKDADFSKFPHVHELYESQSTKEIDVNTLSLESYEEGKEDDKFLILKPYTEVCNNEGFTEILVEIPGIDHEDVELSFKNQGKKLVFRAGNENRKYMTTVTLPFQSSIENCNLEVKNGVGIIHVSKATY